MKITEEIKAKVMLPYLGVKVDLSKTQWYKQEAKLRNRFIQATLAGINLHENSKRACIQHNIRTQNDGLQWLDFSAFKLILKPLSEITDKEILQVAKLNGYRVDGSYKNYTIEITKGALLGKRPDVKIVNVECWQYLTSRGYDLPYFLLGGKTLKQSGIAIYEQQLKKLKK